MILNNIPMNVLAKPPEALDGQLKDRTLYVLDADDLPINSESLLTLLTNKLHHCLQSAPGKRASMQVFICNTPDGVIIVFTGQPGSRDAPPKDIASLEDITPKILNKWNPVTSFFKEYDSKNKTSFLLRDKNPRNPVGPLPHTDENPNKSKDTAFGEIIERINGSPHEHIVSFTIRAKVITGVSTHWAFNGDPPKPLRQYLTNRVDENLDNEDLVYNVQPAEIVAYDSDQIQPPEPIISCLTDLSTSDHSYIYEEKQMDTVTEDIAYARTKISAKPVYWRILGRDRHKRSLELMEKDMYTLLQRQRSPTRGQHEV